MNQTSTLRTASGTFSECLSTLRRRFPRGGYTGCTRVHKRLVSTFKLFSRHYFGGPIVDIGSWPGDFACTLASMNYEISAVDRCIDRPIVHNGTTFDSTDGLLTLAEKCRAYGMGIAQCDVETDMLPYTDASVDFVILTEVIEHLRKNPLHALREIRRVLKFEGHILVSSPNLLSLNNRISFALGRNEYENLHLPYDVFAAEESIGHGGKFRLYSMHELVHLLQQTGFQVVAQQFAQIRETPTLRKKPRNFIWFLKYLVVLLRPSLRNTLFLVAKPRP